MKRRSIGALCLALLLTLTACGKEAEEPESPSPMPTPTGYSPTGRENPNVPKSEYQEEAFISIGGFTIYTAGGAASHIGVDVSSHQKEIDWAQVKEAGVEFAMIRVGYRGYSGGGIYPDDYFAENIQGALDAGLRVGVYFFSQAVNEEEAKEEARATLEWIAPYNVTYPVVFDWEPIVQDTARTDEVEAETVTGCVKAFCDTVEAEGYIPMVYFNSNHVYNVIDLEQLEGYEFWLAGYRRAPAFEYAFDMWQYSCTGQVPGIQTDVDLNLCLVDYPAEGKRLEDPEDFPSQG